VTRSSAARGSRRRHGETRRVPGDFESALDLGDRAPYRGLGSRPIDLSNEENWPEVEDESPAAWKRAVESMKSTHRKLGREIAKLKPARLDAGYGRRKQYKIFRLVHGVVYHELYHAGQIAILKKG